ncbi:hypothetical protein LCGC14_1368410 [marine sediment metagenome]|uniref:Uncharacterized protein n=1 Tax=marine sediment metagenome TaxID=412755 RepID=A0A0F9KS22_9ZZZZ
MCEPYHSVVQYSKDFDDTNLPFGDNIDKETRLKAALGKAFGWTKRVGRWFHLSRFGAGHSGASMETAHASRYLPFPTLYEGQWWHRKFVLDSWGAKADADALAAAEKYHHVSVLGSMSLFRRFLETSMVKTNHLYGASVYVETMIDHVFTKEGSNKLLEKFRRVFGKSAVPAHVMNRQSSVQEIEKGIKIVMGFTRRRELFLPHFADDDSLWVPGGKAESTQ